VLDALVFGISPRDTSTLIAAALAVTAIGVLSAALPLARATAVDAGDKLAHRPSL
jgi:hypothetical protein